MHGRKDTSLLLLSTRLIFSSSNRFEFQRKQAFTTYVVGGKEAFLASEAALPPSRFVCGKRGKKGGC